MRLNSRLSWFAPALIAGLVAVPALSQQVFNPTGKEGRSVGELGDEPRPELIPPIQEAPTPGHELPSRWLPPEWEARLPKIEEIRPIPPAAIPDDPPPHEGAMIDIHEVVEPPDLIRVEVLEALPGRPITGERLVRPDGTITLGFYGDIHIRGLTIDQIKVKVILHMRRYLDDEVLGLLGFDPDGKVIMIQPEFSDRVFVDIAAHNSDVYYVQGDLGSPGRLPSTGKETVLDALNYAASLNPTANPKDIKLVRPAQGDGPAKVYPIDLEAILERGDKSSNLQLFPDDRIVVGRHPVVVATIESDRIAAPLNTAFNTMLQHTYLIDSFNKLVDARKLTPEQRGELVGRMADFAWNITQRAEGQPLGEEEYKRMIRLLLDEEQH